jgi:peroxiredoxin
MDGTPEDEDVVSVLYPESPLGKGDKVPSGVLKTASGRSVDTAKLLVGQPSVIIYYRGEWCPYCNKHLAGLVDIVDDLKSNGFQLLAISPDRPDILMDKEDLSKLSYDLLSDSSMEVALVSLESRSKFRMSWLRSTRTLTESILRPTLARPTTFCLTHPFLSWMRRESSGSPM